MLIDQVVSILDGLGLTFEISLTFFEHPFLLIEILKVLTTLFIALISLFLLFLCNLVFYGLQLHAAVLLLDFLLDLVADLVSVAVGFERADGVDLCSVFNNVLLMPGC